MATILVIDDQASIRALLRVILENEGHEVVEAANGRAGLALYRDQPTDLVITDIQMPEMNGLELIEELTRSFSPPGTAPDVAMVNRVLGILMVWIAAFSLKFGKA